jgi:hypothetical protein
MLRPLDIIDIYVLKGSLTKTGASNPKIEHTPMTVLLINLRGQFTTL